MDEIQGVSYEWLCEFFSLYKNLTTRDIVNKIIIPKTLNNQKPYLYMIPENHKGNPDYFVTHAWDDIFSNGLNRLKPIFLKPSLVFLWIDIFCINQHLNNINIKDTLIDVLKNVNSLIIKNENNIV